MVWGLRPSGSAAAWHCRAVWGKLPAECGVHVDRVHGLHAAGSSAMQLKSSPSQVASHPSSEVASPCLVQGACSWPEQPTDRQGLGCRYALAGPSASHGSPCAAHKRTCRSSCLLLCQTSLADSDEGGSYRRCGGCARQPRVEGAAATVCHQAV